jgi:hypothetical protein
LPLLLHVLLLPRLLHVLLLPQLLHVQLLPRLLLLQRNNSLQTYIVKPQTNAIQN